MKRIISVLLTLVMVLALVPCMAQAEQVQLIDSSAKFTDVPANSWYKQFVDYAVTHNLFQGTTDKTFAPNTAMTRSMFVTVLARIEGVAVDNSKPTSFTDVPAGKWYAGSVQWAFENRIVNGTGATTFSPDDNITREQICTMLVRYGNEKKVTFKSDAQGVAFTDAHLIASWAAEAVGICQKAGIVSGTPGGAFDPKGVATRSQAAKILNIFHADYMAAPETPVTPPAEDPVTPPAEEPVTPPAEDPVTPPADDPFAACALRANNASKYNYDENPLIRRGKGLNKSYLPSFDMDCTGFVREETKLSDLKGKTLAFFVTDCPTWSYRGPSGETITEWDWFKALKAELGLNIKYTLKYGRNSLNSALQYMNAGKQCDIIYSNYASMPSALCISAPITDLININDKGSAPGVCYKTMNACKWANSYRAIAPIGGVDVLWYNETLTSQLQLSDPHAMWEAGVWNWDRFYSYLKSIPATDQNGQELTAFVQRAESAAFIWPYTNGSPVFAIDTASSVPTIVNNWNSAKTLEAWKFITKTCSEVKYSAQEEQYLGLYEGKTLMSSTMSYVQTYHDTEYGKTMKLNWVPYPKSPTGVDVAHWNGYGMMLPKKTSKPDNVNVALKFMELWATRYSETIFDNLASFEYYGFNYKEQKQFYEYVTQNTVFSLPMDLFTGSSINTETNFFNCFKGIGYNVETEAQKASDLVNAHLIQTLKFGL